MYIRIIFFILFIFTLPFSIYSQVISFNLDEMIERGLLVYPDLKRKQHEIRHAYLRQQEAFNRRLPDMTANVYYNYLPDVYKFTDSENLKKLYVNFNDWRNFIYGSISMTIPIYTFGKIENASKAAEYNIELKKAEYQETEGMVRYYMKNLAWGYLFGYSVIENILKDVIPRYEKIVRDREKEFEQGKISRATLEYTRITYYDLQRGEIDVKRLMQENETMIQAIMGIQESEKIEVKQKRLKPVELEIKEWDYYLDLARQYNPGFRKSHYGYLARKYWMEYEKSDLLPNIFFYMNGFFQTRSLYDWEKQGITGKESVIPGRDFGLYAVFGITWNISFWSRYNLWQQRETTFNIELETIKAGYEMQEIEIKKAYENLVEKQKRLFYSTEQFRAAKRWLILSINAYKTGAGNIDEAQNGLTTLYHRKRDYYSCIYEFNLAVAHFERVLGIELVDYKKEFQKMTGKEDEED